MQKPYFVGCDAQEIIDEVINGVKHQDAALLERGQSHCTNTCLAPEIGRIIYTALEFADADSLI
jgi:hypothetical protein